MTNVAAAQRVLQLCINKYVFSLAWIVLTLTSEGLLMKHHHAPPLIFLFI